MAVPVRSDGVTVGSLSVGTLWPQTFSETEREMLEILAEHAGIALLDANSRESVRLALTDHLTGLPNRRLFLDRLTQGIEQSRRDGHPLAVLFIDLDGFKAINDGRGHAAGDGVLKEVARRIERTIERAGSAARLGGDEFVVMLEQLRPGPRRDIRRRHRPGDQSAAALRPAPVLRRRDDRRGDGRRRACRRRGAAPTGRHRDVSRQARGTQQGRDLRAIDGAGRHRPRRARGRAPARDPQPGDLRRVPAGRRPADRHRDVGRGARPMDQRDAGSDRTDPLRRARRADEHGRRARPGHDRVVMPVDPRRRRPGHPAARQPVGQPVATAPRPPRRRRGLARRAPRRGLPRRRA